MSIGDELLMFLSNHPGNYRELRERMLSRVGPSGYEEYLSHKRNKEISDSCLRSTLSRLKKNGLIENKKDSGLWKVTAVGQRKLAKVKFLKKIFDKPKNKSNRKMIIAFDIPEIRKRDRDWLRLGLLNLDFKMMQKSVWLGPAPLPKDFIESLIVAKIMPYIKFFEVKKTDII